MTGSTIIDVVIGLIFIYLLYSLFTTILQEIISTFFRFRAKILELSIVRMLEDGKTDMSEFQKKFGGTFRLFTSTKIIDKEGFRIARSFYYHPLIKYLAENDTYSQPSYLTAENFSKVMLDLFRGPNGASAQDLSLFKTAVENGRVFNYSRAYDRGPRSLSIARQSSIFINSLWLDSQGDIERFKVNLEKWFQDTQAHTIGWYKRHIQKVLFVLGFFVAIMFNVDTIEITKKLWRNPILARQLADRAQMVSDNQSKVESNKPIQTDEQFAKDNQELIKSIDGTNNLLGLGWDKSKMVWLVDFEKEDYRQFFIQVLGWLITALAISLGAPFWFDLLNKFMSLRTAGKKPDEEAKPSNTSKEPIIG